MTRYLNGPLRRLALPALFFVSLTAAGLYIIYDRIGAQGLVFDRRFITPRVLTGTALLLTVYFVSDGLRLYFTLRAIGEKIRFRVLFSGRSGRHSRPWLFCISASSPSCCCGPAG